MKQFEIKGHFHYAKVTNDGRDNAIGIDFTFNSREDITEEEMAYIAETFFNTILGAFSQEAITDNEEDAFKQERECWNKKMKIRN